VTYQAAAATLNLGGPTTFNSQVLSAINSNFDSNWTGLLDLPSGYPLESSFNLLLPLLTYPTGTPYNVYFYQQLMLAVSVKYIGDLCRQILLLPALPTTITF
jgi:hypothetical protein